MRECTLCVCTLKTRTAGRRLKKGVVYRSKRSEAVPNSVGEKADEIKEPKENNKRNVLLEAARMQWRSLLTYLGQGRDSRLARKIS
jgi:hypothetical protein